GITCRFDSRAHPRIRPASRCEVARRNLWVGADPPFFSRGRPPRDQPANDSALALDSPRRGRGMGKPTGLANEQQRALGELTKVGALRTFYLAGGSAIAWHLHHRRSNDLDLFSESQVDLDRVERAMKRVKGTEIVSITDSTIRLELSG